MYSNTVKHALKAGQLQLGMNFGQLRSSEIPRLLAAADFHWAFIDTERGGFDLETVQDICRVAQLAGLETALSWTKFPPASETAKALLNEKKEQ